jgi:putative colanic acid biosynthesis acetyltransferase WcaF
MSQSVEDPYAIPAFGLANRLARVAWAVCYLLMFRPSPRPFFGWRRLILRVFGAKLGKGVVIYPSAKIWAPWNLVCEDMVAIANGADIYNPSPIWLGSHAIVSQDAFLCGASHDYNDVRFPLYSKPIHVGPYAWVCARSCVMPGITLQEGAVLGLGAIATKDLASWSVYAGSPAKLVAARSVGHSTVNPEK